MSVKYQPQRQASYEVQGNKNMKTEFLHARSWLSKGSLSPEESRSRDFVC